jgi:hypothetical protein
MARPKATEPAPTTALAIPDAMRRRLAPWIDVGEAGAEGFWHWLDTVLPLLPTPSGEEPLGPPPPELPPGRMGELARDLVDCASDRSRLTILCARYFEDGRVLTRRLKALEATLRTYQRAGQPAEVSPDREAERAAERYLPPRRGRPS